MPLACTSLTHLAGAQRMYTSHSTRTAHAHTRQQRSAAAHIHSADALVASPADTLVAVPIRFFPDNAHRLSLPCRMTDGPLRISG
jgi:hypothetical protein